MKISPRFSADNAHRFSFVKAPEVDAPEAQRDPAVAERVAGMLAEIAADGIEAVRRYATELDGADVVELTGEELAATGDRLDPALRAAIELGAERTQQFARLQRDHLTDFEAELLPA